MSADDLHRENEELRAELRQQRRLNQGLQRQMARLLDEVAKLVAKEDKKPQKRGKKGKGKPKSPPPTDAPKAPARDESAGEKKDKGVPKRRPLPDHFERSTERHQLQPWQCCMAPKLRQIDDKVVEQLDYVPARVEVRRQELEQWLCDSCGTKQRAPMPPIAVPSGSMTARMLA